ncbi:hypothetical protein OFO99_27735, partial [Escherichia coli]|nr:hypothetical protein [Escherichia coli]
MSIMLFDVAFRLKNQQEHSAEYNNKKGFLMLAKPIVRWLLPFVVVGGSYAGYAAIAATAPEKESTKETIT